VDYTGVDKLKDKTSMEAAMYLLKEVGVACVNGDNFYGNKSEESSNKYLRFAACRSDEDIEDANRRLAKLKND
jgi:aspartate/methionine/tyrosine aminotransferase